MQITSLHIEDFNRTDLAIELEIEKKLRLYFSREVNFFDYYVSILLLRDMLCEKRVFENNKIMDIDIFDPK